MQCQRRSHAVKDQAWHTRSTTITSHHDDRRHYDRDDDDQEDQDRRNKDEEQQDQDPKDHRNRHRQGAKKQVEAPRSLECGPRKCARDCGGCTLSGDGNWSRGQNMC